VREFVTEIGRRRFSGVVLGVGGVIVVVVVVVRAFKMELSL
jgi:hypothetical protein